MAKTAYKTAKWVASLVNTEIKYSDTALTGTPITNTPDIRLINGVALGDTTTTRDGISIKMHDIDVKMTIDVNSAAASAQKVRCMIFADRQADGVVPTGAEILAANTTTAFRNIILAKRFHVFYDRVWTVDQDKKSLSPYIHIKTRAHVRYSGNTAAASDVATGSIYLLLLSDNPISGPVVSYNTRLRFVDN